MFTHTAIYVICLKLFPKAFHIFAGITMNAHIKSVQNIFIDTQTKLATTKVNKILYKSTLIFDVLAISGLIETAKNFLPISLNIIKSDKNTTEIVIKSLLLIDKMLQKRKLFISTCNQGRNQIRNIARAIIIWEMNSKAESLVTLFDFPIKKINSPQIQAKSNALRVKFIQIINQITIQSREELAIAWPNWTCLLSTINTQTTQAVIQINIPQKIAFWKNG